MPPFAYGYGQKFVGDDDLHGTVFFIDDHPGNLSRRKGIADKFGGIHVPGDDVDFLTPEFLDNVLDPAAFHAHACADRIDIRIL